MYKQLNTGAVNLHVGFQRACQLAGEYGFGAVEWDPLDAIGVHGLYGAQDIMGQCGAIIGGCPMPVNIWGVDAAFEEGFARLKPYAQAARDLGIHRSCTWIPSWSDDMSYDAFYSAGVRRLRNVAEVYGEYNIRLGLEFVGPKELYAGKKVEFIHTMQGALDLIADVGMPNVGLLVDVYHCFTAGMEPGDCLRPLKGDENKIVLVHINDAMKGIPVDELKDQLRYLPGEGGGIDLPAFFRALMAIRYTGPVVVEPFSQTLKAMTDEDEIMQALSESVESVWPNGEGDR